MDDEGNESKQVVIRERQKAKQIGRTLWIVTITTGILGWILWNWFAFPISIGLAFLIGSIYSYRVTKRVEVDTNLSIEEQEALLKNRSIQELKKNYGLRHNDKGELVFDFADKEQAKIEETFRTFQNYKVHSDYVNELQKMLVCLSLVDLGNDYIFQVDLIEAKDETKKRKQEIDGLLEHAIIEYSKVFSIYSIKAILTSAATTFIRKNDFVRSKEFLQKYFSYIQLNNYSDKITNLFLQWHLKALGYSSLQELGVTVREQLSHL